MPRSQSIRAGTQARVMEESAYWLVLYGLLSTPHQCIFYYFKLRVYLCICAHECNFLLRSEVSDLLELELQVTMSP